MSVNIDRRRETNRNWRLNNPDKAKAAAKRWREQNPEKYKQYMLDWRKNHPEKDEEYRKAYAERRRVGALKRYYGLTIEEVENIFLSQNGCCAICKNEFQDRKTMHIDHNHQTGKVRGLLCNGCNHGIGHFQENPDNLLNAFQYLTHWK